MHISPYYIIIALLCCGVVYATTTILPKSNAVEKAERYFQKGDTAKAVGTLEKAGEKGDIAACRYLYHYYDSIYGPPSEAYAEIEEVITPDGDWIWYGNPDEKPDGARLPTEEERGDNELVETVVQDTLPGNDIPIQWYWLRVLGKDR